jgi:flavin reductase (DIM6/NTAB) family NADH-FMN oxidoreductase RutF
MVLRLERSMAHVVSEPAILYFGTPVVLVGTTNEDGSYNLAPISSAFWLGWRCILGIAASSKTTHNLKRTGECVLNLPAVGNVAAVNRLARTTGSDPVPEGKRQRGYRFEPDKFALAGLTPVAGEVVAAPRVAEVPVQLEAKVENVHGLAEDNPAVRGRLHVIEVRVVRVHVDDSILMSGQQNRIDPDKWRPLIMSFQEFYGLASSRAHASELGRIPERLYRSPEVDSARAEPLLARTA